MYVISSPMQCYQVHRHTHKDHHAVVTWKFGKAPITRRGRAVTHSLISEWAACSDVKFTRRKLALSIMTLPPRVICTWHWLGLNKVHQGDFRRLPLCRYLVVARLVTNNVQWLVQLLVTIVKTRERHLYNLYGVGGRAGYTPDFRRF